MMFVSEFITDAPSAMPAEASVLPLEPIKVDEVLRRIAHDCRSFRNATLKMEAAAASVRSLDAMLLTQSVQTA
jgi:hypothetical protein